MEIITITNHKGGVGKTTTALTIANGLTLKGYKVLFIDLDGQQDAQAHTDAQSERFNILDVMADVVPITHAITSNNVTGYFIGCDDRIKNISFLLMDNETGQIDYKLLRKKLDPIKKIYDFVIIDTGPNVGNEHTMAMASADKLIIPFNKDAYNMKALQKIDKEFNQIKKLINPGLKIELVLLTEYIEQYKDDKEAKALLTQWANKYGAEMRTITKTAVINKTQWESQTVLTYKMAKRDNTGQKAKTEYMDVIDIIINHH